MKKISIVQDMYTWYSLYIIEPSFKKVQIEIIIIVVLLIVLSKGRIEWMHLEIKRNQKMYNKQKQKIPFTGINFFIRETLIRRFRLKWTKN